MSIFVSSFYNNKRKKAESVITPLRQFDKYTIDDMRAYIDSYIPVEQRTVDGIDSLYIMSFDADFTIHSTQGVMVRHENR